ELLDDRLLPAAQLVDVHAGLAAAKRDAEAAHLLDLVDDPGDVQQRLGGDAADVQADSAQPRVSLDQGRLEAEVRGAESGAVAAGARADHEYGRLEVDLPSVRRACVGSGRGRPGCRGWRSASGCGCGCGGRGPLLGARGR